MTIYLKQSTASQEILIGMMMDSSDGVTPKTGLTIANTDILIWKAGGTTVGAKNSGNATEISTGYYYATLDDTDTNTLGSMIINVNVAGALMWRGEFVVVTANWYDSMFSTDKLDVSVVQVNGAAQTATLDTIKAETVLIVEDTGTTLPATLATIDGIVDAILVDTAVIGALGAGLTAIPWNAAWDAEVQSEVTDALNAYDPPTNAEMEARTIVAANYATAAALDAVDNFLDTEIAAILADTNELQTDWHDGGRLDLLLDGAASAGDPWTTALPGAYGDGTAGKILGTTVTGALTTIDGIVDDILVDTGTTLPATLATIDGIVDDILVDTGTTLPATLDTIDNFLDTEVAAILADTNELQTDLTNGGRLDLLIDAILEDTGTTLPATLTTIDNFLDTEVAAILADTNELQTDLTNGGRLDLLIDAIKAKTDLVALASVCTETRLAQLDEANMPTDLDNIFDDVGDVQATANTILADTNELQAEFVNGGRLDLLIDAILEDTGTTLPATLATIDGLADDIKALVGGYSLASPVFDGDGNMTSATITANGKTFTVTATYDVDTNLATYEIVEA